MRLLAGTCLVALLVHSTSFAQPATPAAAGTAAQTANDAERLPVKRVVLYKNGVGFFEHLGRVHGTQAGDDRLHERPARTTSLKSLTTVDLGNGKVTGISFNTDDPASRKLGALSLPLEENTTVLAFLGAHARGARRGAASATGPVVGQILTVESRTRVEGDATIETRELAIVTDAGELQDRRGHAADRRCAWSIASLRGDIRRYLDIVASTRQRDLRRMTIATTRERRSATLRELHQRGADLEEHVPTGAALRKPGDKPLLQGWAIVDNTIGEDWTDVELSLVAGVAAVVRPAPVAAALRATSSHPVAVRDAAVAADARRHAGDRGSC